MLARLSPSAVTALLQEAVALSVICVASLTAGASPICFSMHMHKHLSERLFSGGVYLYQNWEEEPIKSKVCPGFSSRSWHAHCA
jgi:hypothetical protein